MKGIHGVEVYWDRDQLSTYRGKNSMFVVSPLREERKIVEHIFGIRMEDMRTVFVDKDARLVVVVKSVATYVGPAINQHHPFPEIPSHLRGHYGSRKSCSYDQVVKHGLLLLTEI